MGAGPVPGLRCPWVGTEDRGRQEGHCSDLTRQVLGTEGDSDSTRLADPDRSVIADDSDDDSVHARRNTIARHSVAAFGKR